jgi:hypothetical protein
VYPVDDDQAYVFMILQELCEAANRQIKLDSAVNLEQV